MLRAKLAQEIMDATLEGDQKNVEELVMKLRILDAIRSCFAKEPPSEGAKDPIPDKVDGKKKPGKKPKYDYDLNDPRDYAIYRAGYCRAYYGKRAGKKECEYENEEPESKKGYILVCQSIDDSLRECFWQATASATQYHKKIIDNIIEARRVSGESRKNIKTRKIICDALEYYYRDNYLQLKKKED
jgi:hypothetical protein